MRVLLCGGGWSGGKDRVAVGQSVNDLPDRGRGVKVHNQVVCDYRSQQMTNNDGKHKYNNSPEQVVGCMFASYSGGTPTLLSTAHLRPVM